MPGASPDSAQHQHGLVLGIVEMDEIAVGIAWVGSAPVDHREVGRLAEH